LVPGFEATTGNDVDRSAKKIFELLIEHQVEQ
jgi:hypothetical protein